MIDKNLTIIIKLHQFFIKLATIKTDNTVSSLKCAVSFRVDNHMVFSHIVRKFACATDNLFTWNNETILHSKLHVQIKLAGPS